MPNSNSCKIKSVNLLKNAVKLDLNELSELEVTISSGR